MTLCLVFQMYQFNQQEEDKLGHSAGNKQYAGAAAYRTAMIQLQKDEKARRNVTILRYVVDRVLGPG